MGRYGGLFSNRRGLSHPENKMDDVLDMFAQELVGVLDVSAFHSEVTSGYRQRCRFSMCGGDEEALSFSINTKPIASFELASDRINDLMPHLVASLRQSRARDLRAVHFHAPRRRDSHVLVTLVYGSNIGEDWIEEFDEVRQNLDENVSFVGRCKGKTLLSGASRATAEELDLGDRKVLLEFPEGSFCHPNVVANEKSVVWLAKRISSLSTKPSLLELYCGAGNHTVALAPSCSRLVGVEIDPVLVDAARNNLIANGITNAKVVASDARLYSQRLVRSKNQANDKFDAILVDPPRRGLDDLTRRLLLRFSNIFYVSCNPDALKNDVVALDSTHKIAAFAALDAFPNTPHLECLVHFVRRE